MKSIPFTCDMVRAILEGRKTQTRRPIKIQPSHDDYQLLTLMDSTYSADKHNLGKHHWGKIVNYEIVADDGAYFKSPWQKGDRLWVRERVRLIDCLGFMCKFKFEANDSETEWVTYPERLQPLKIGNCVPNGCYRELARIILEVDDVWHERIQDITEDNARAEGLNCIPPDPEISWPGLSCKDNFCDLWMNLYGYDSLHSNSHIWAVKFHRINDLEGALNHG